MTRNKVCVVCAFREEMDDYAGEGIDCMLLNNPDQWTDYSDFNGQFDCVWVSPHAVDEAVRIYELRRSEIVPFFFRGFSQYTVKGTVDTIIVSSKTNKGPTDVV